MMPHQPDLIHLDLTERVPFSWRDDALKAFVVFTIIGLLVWLF